MMYGLVRDSAVVGLAKRAARPARRAYRRAPKARQVPVSVWIETLVAFAVVGVAVVRGLMRFGRLLRGRLTGRGEGR